jgi:hypothetical protein
LLREKLDGEESRFDSEGVHLECYYREQGGIP